MTRPLLVKLEDLQSSKIGTLWNGDPHTVTSLPGNITPHSHNITPHSHSQLGPFVKGIDQGWSNTTSPTYALWQLEQLFVRKHVLTFPEATCKRIVYRGGTVHMLKSRIPKTRVQLSFREFPIRMFDAKKHRRWRPLY